MAKLPESARDRSIYAVPAKRRYVVFRHLLYVKYTRVVQFDTIISVEYD